MASSRGGAVIDGADLRERTDRLFERWNRGGSPGCAAAVLQAGRVLFARGYGLASVADRTPILPGTRFPLGSLSEQFTAFAVGLLAEEGRIDLDGDVRTHLPDLADLGARITVRHLLTHTSGLRDVEALDLAGWRREDTVTTADVLGLVRRQRAPQFAPGTRQLCSDTGYVLAGLVVEAVSGTSFAEFCAARVFGPLGMVDTGVLPTGRAAAAGVARGHTPGPDGGFLEARPRCDFVGAANVVTTVPDLSRWDANLATGAVGGRAVVGRLVEPAALPGGRPGIYGMGWRLGAHRGVRTVEQGGSDNGFACHVLRFPDREATMLVLANVDDVQPRDLCFRLADLWLEDALGAEAPRPAPRRHADGLEGLAGLYVESSSGRVAELSLAGGRPAIRFDRLTRAQALRRLPGGGLRFAAENGTVVRVGRADRRLELAEPWGEVARCAPAEPFRAAPRELERYRGRYWSDELEAGCTVRPGPDGLVLATDRDSTVLTLSPLVRDVFFAPGEGSAAGYARAEVRFTGAAGWPAAELTISTPCAWGIRFARRPDAR